MDSLCSSERPRAPSPAEAAPRAGVLRVMGRGLFSVVVLAAMGGCVTVRPEQREVLADPAMTFGSGGDAEAHEEHVLSNREGSIGGGATSGGGCGCN